MKNKPLVSICMPVYNGEKTIHRAIECLINQSYTNIELIISNNCSTDDTKKICLSYQKKYKFIKYFEQSKNLGSPKNFNFLLEISKGEFFMWACHDDEWNAEYVEDAVNLLTENESAVSAMGRVRVFSNNKKLIYEDLPDYKLDKNKKERLRNFIQYNYGDNLFFALHRKKNALCANFDTSVFGSEIIFIYKMLNHGKIINSKKMVFTKNSVFHISKSNKLAQGKTKFEQKKIYNLNENFWTRHGMMIKLILYTVRKIEFSISLFILFDIICYRNPVVRFFRILPKDLKNRINNTY